MTVRSSELIYTEFLLGGLTTKSSQLFLKPTSESSSAGATATPHSGLTDEHGPVH
jgi:hypothetical protein